MGTTTAAITDLHPPADEELVRRVLAGEVAAYEVIMRRHNQRLYRALRAILRNDAEAEDVLQETYVRAYQHLRGFRGQSRFSTWLTRIAINEALARLRRRKRFSDLAGGDEAKGDAMDRIESRNPDPEQQLLESETRHLLEAAIDALPEPYRIVFALREIEEMDTAEAAEYLELTEETVKVRLHRAKRMLRRDLCARTGSAGKEVFAFMGERCDRVVHSVLEILGSSGPGPS
jgi:RNA polymerase sigma-70 factor (ECF subfamily)